MPDLAWFAGLFEGEGCISIHGAGRRGYTILSASVEMVDCDVVAAFAERWPAKITVVNRAAGHRTSYSWRLRGATAARFIAEIAPYFVSARNKARADVADQYLHAMTQGSRRPSYRSEMAAFRQRMSGLNVKGGD